MFVDGKVAMFAVGPFLVGFAAEQNAQAYKHIEATTLPLPGNQATAISVFLGIPKNAKNKDAAGRFIATLLKPEMQRTVVETVMALPAVKDAVPAQFLQQTHGSVPSSRRADRLFRSRPKEWRNTALRSTISSGPPSKTSSSTGRTWKKPLTGFSRSWRSLLPERR